MDKPIRLEKKNECGKVEFICALMKRPEFWLIILIAIIFLLLIIIAFRESSSSFYYNTGINSTL